MRPGLGTEGNAELLKIRDWLRDEADSETRAETLSQFIKFTIYLLVVRQLASANSRMERPGCSHRNYYCWLISPPAKTPGDTNKEERRKMR